MEEFRPTTIPVTCGRTRASTVPFGLVHLRGGMRAAVLTEFGGHAYELGVGVGPNRTGGRKVPVRRGVLPSEDQMRKLFRHESTRFGNPKDRDVVVELYLGLRAKVEALENEINSCPDTVRKADALLTSEDGGGARKLHFSRILMLLTTLGLVLFGRVGLITDEYTRFWDSFWNSSCVCVERLGCLHRLDEIPSKPHLAGAPCRRAVLPPAGLPQAQHIPLEPPQAALSASTPPSLWAGVARRS